MQVCLLSSSLNPPSPSSNDDETVGRRLMALVRFTEKQGNDDEDTELCDLLAELISLYSRRGLLQGNVVKARKVLESSSPSKARGGNHKRDTTSDATLSTDDESLILSALIRTLTSKGSTCSSYVVALAADVCTAISMHVQDESSAQTACAMAEQEVLLKSSKALLTGLGATMSSLAVLSCRSVQEALALVSCLRATTTLISLLGQKVPRPTISTIRKVAWTALIDTDTQVQQSSALLLSSLPLTGADNTSPADAWSGCVLNAVGALAMILDAMAPLRPRKTRLKIQSKEAQTTVAEWLNTVTSIENEAERMHAFQCYTQGLSAYLVALLTRQAYPDSSKILLMTAKLPVEALLDLCESMILFPSAAETLFFSTKKRLRLEVIQNGLLSPAAVALEMANLVKYLGHGVLDATITAAVSSLLPFARHVMRITHASLLASSSTALQTVLDPTRGALRADGNRKPWLHNSIVLRTRAIKTYNAAIRTFGACVVAGSLSNQEAMGTNSSHDETLAISSVGGSLLEQLSWPEETDNGWATMSERVDLW